MKIFFLIIGVFFLFYVNIVGSIENKCQKISHIHFVGLSFFLFLLISLKILF